jgi:hypothetical protein
MPYTCYARKRTDKPIGANKMIYYSTGRTYNKPQRLAIDAPAAPADPIADVRVTFEDAARGISGAVTLMAFELAGDIGASVLREYDAGRYSLI